MSFDKIRRGIVQIFGNPNAEVRPIDWVELDLLEQEYYNKLRSVWGELKVDVFQLFGLPITESVSSTYNDIQTALKRILSKMSLKAEMSVINDYYSRAYTLGTVKGAQIAGRAAPTSKPSVSYEYDDPMLKEMKRTGFRLVKNNLVKSLKKDIMPVIRDGIKSGQDTISIAQTLSERFDIKDYDWKRLARSEMTMAAERAKLKEMKLDGITRVRWIPAKGACIVCVHKAGIYPIERAPLPVRDSHPNCRCGLGLVHERS